MDPAAPGEAMDPRQVATQALDRLQQGEGWLRTEDESGEEEWYDLEGLDDPWGGHADLGSEARAVDADELRRPDGVEDEVARRSDAETPPRYSSASLPTGEDRSAVSSQVIPLPQGEGKIEGMGESFAPQLNTGTATFTVPIAVPPGRAGAQPGLALRARA